MNIHDVKRQLQAANPREMFEQLSVPFSIGLLSGRVLSALKMYVAMQGWNNTISYEGGVLTKDYLLTIRDIRASEALHFLEYMEKLFQ